MSTDSPEAHSLPDSQRRWRCAHCGNLTRFDVIRSRRNREFWHTDLAGEVAIEQVEVLDEVVESVTCRWCSSADHVETVPRPGSDDRSSN